MAMVRLIVCVLLLVGGAAEAQAPKNAVQLLKNAQVELQEAAKALNESKEYQRFQRAKANVEGWQAVVDAEKPKAETESK